MAKKTSKKTEEQVINEVEITETVQETVKEEKQFEPEVQEVVDTIMEKIEENTPETTEPEEFLEKEISMGEEITEIQEDFKDTSARLEELVNNNKENLKEALEGELKEVLKAEEIVEKTIKSIEKTTKNKPFSHYRDFGNWWNGSNSGL